jgi:hypothetical protein
LAHGPEENWGRRGRFSGFMTILWERGQPRDECEWREGAPMGCWLQGRGVYRGARFAATVRSGFGQCPSRAVGVVSAPWRQVVTRATAEEARREQGFG